MSGYPDGRNVTHRASGTCQECGREVTLNTDGSLHAHYTNGIRNGATCPGTYAPPVEDAQLDEIRGD